MSPKKKLGKELPTESSSQAVEGQIPIIAQTTTQTTHISHKHPQNLLLQQQKIEDPKTQWNNQQPERKCSP
jgi:hypothetical protein